VERFAVRSVLVVSATRLDVYSFWATAPLGLSLKHLAFESRLTYAVAALNAGGLPGVFNAQINEQNRSKILLFLHDDVWLDDYFLIDRIMDAVQVFDLVGVAGNVRRVSHQPAWCFINERFEWDDHSNLTGAIGAGQRPFGTVNYYGPTPQACRLLDGVLLAAPCDVLLEKQVCFDDRFPFHFYDMDFCRTAEARGLRLGTWPIAITHVSGGGFNTPAWKEARDRYFEKWTE
jgi:hypothetical protein